MKYCFLILVLLLMLLPEVTPGNRVIFRALPAKTERVALAASTERSLSNCPSTEQDSYLKQAFCSCKSLLTDNNSSPVRQVANNPNENFLSQNSSLQGPKSKVREADFLSKLFDFSYSSGQEK